MIQVSVLLPVASSPTLPGTDCCKATQHGLAGPPLPMGPYLVGPCLLLGSGPPSKFMTE